MFVFSFSYDNKSHPDTDSEINGYITMWHHNNICPGSTEKYFNSFWLNIPTVSGLCIDESVSSKHLSVLIVPTHCSSPSSYLVTRCLLMRSCFSHQSVIVIASQLVVTTLSTLTPTHRDILRKRPVTPLLFTGT